MEEEYGRKVRDELNVEGGLASRRRHVPAGMRGPSSPAQVHAIEGALAVAQLDRAVNIASDEPGGRERAGWGRSGGLDTF